MANGTGDPVGSVNFREGSRVPGINNKDEDNSPKNCWEKLSRIEIIVIFKIIIVEFAVPANH